MHVRQIESALREIIGTLKSKNASQDSSAMRTTLLEYADDHNLAPAQLEKLAQTLNVSLALAHAKQASPDKRGEQFDIVDIPALMDRFEDPGRTRHKQASVVNVPAEWQSFSVGQHFHEPRKPFDWKKVDNHFADNSHNIGGWQKAASHLPQASWQDAATLGKLADDAWKDVTRGLTKAAELVGRQPSVYVEIVQDVEAHLGEKAATVLEALDNQLRFLRYPHAKCAGDDTRDFVTDRHGIVDDMRKVADALEQRHTCQEMAKEAAAAKTQTKAKTDKDKGGGRTPEPFVPGRPAPGAYDNSVGDFKPEKPVQTDPELARLLFGPVSAAGHVAQELGHISSQATSQDPARTMADNYALLFGHNRAGAGQRLESSVQKWQHAAVLQRLLLSDPVLSRADPSQVVAAFDTVRRNNPALARDINVSRILLREAVQYQGVPIQSVETLQKLNRPVADPKVAA